MDLIHGGYTLRNATIVHDQVGTYSYWYGLKHEPMSLKVLMSFHSYLEGRSKPNFPVPAIPLIHQWDFPLWVMLETYRMTDEEWEREEDAWQDYLDSLDPFFRNA